MIIIRKDGRSIDLKPKPFDDEEDLRRQLLANLNIIPVRDISGEVDESIIAWRSEFPLTVGSVDLASVGDGGGIYLIETKLFKNQDKRKVVAQTLDYVADLWKGYAQDSEKFLDKLQEGGHGEIPKDEGFREDIGQNLRDANYYIMIAMDSVTRQVKDLIEFLNKHTDFKILALEVERYVGDGLEVILPHVYGEEISREVVRRVESTPWSSEQLKIEFEKIADTNLRGRLLKMLEWAVDKNLFIQSRGKVPQFGLKAEAGRVFGVTPEGSLYAYFGNIERGKYPSDENRYEFVKGLKALRLLPQDLNPDDVISGRYLTKRLNQLTEEEFVKLLGLLERHLMATSE
ncbi:hypothetical protein G4O51_11220 [Candidatus Bathyarchaeota archaeon A05DMB-2]|jgi:hypothetical protein|nr:hypothetical protein [Candidatus Bathyarchaeota archaeon A05DMB-2]